MNNSLLALNNREDDEPINVTPILRKREEELNELISALRAIQGSSYWKLLEEKVWNRDYVSLQNRIKTEKDVAEIYRLQGQLARTEKYANLETLVVVFKKELETISNRLQNNVKDSSAGATGSAD